MLPRWKTSVSDKWPSGTAWKLPLGFWAVLTSKSKPYYFYSRFPSSTFRLARNIKFPIPLPIITLIITEGKDMIKSTHRSFPFSSQMTVFKGKQFQPQNELTFPSLHTREQCFLSAECSRRAIPLLIHSGISCNMWSVLQLKTALLSQATGCNSSLCLLRKEGQTLLKRKSSSLEEGKVPKCPPWLVVLPQGTKHQC